MERQQKMVRTSVEVRSGTARSRVGVTAPSISKALSSPNANELRALCALPTHEALPRAAAYLADLVRDQSFLGSHVLPVLEEARGAERWYVARRWDDPEGSFSLQLFVWPPGTATKIHDHSSWGAYACAAGAVFEERYERLDDRSRQDHARIEEVWHLAWTPEDGASTVLPGDGGIHRVGNPHEEAAVSVHLYGPRLGEVDGRDYDPSRDYVCDRPDDQEGGIPEITAREWPVHARLES